MKNDVLAEILALKEASVAELQKKYSEVFDGKKGNSSDSEVALRPARLCEEIPSPVIASEAKQSRDGLGTGCAISF